MCVREEEWAHQVEEVMRWWAGEAGARRPSPALCESKQRVRRGGWRSGSGTDQQLPAGKETSSSALERVYETGRGARLRPANADRHAVSPNPSVPVSASRHRKDVEQSEVAPSGPTAAAPQIPKVGSGGEEFVPRTAWRRRPPTSP